MRRYGFTVPTARADRDAALAAQGGTELREGLSTVTRGTLFVIVTTLLLVLFNFVSRVLLTRTIGKDAWGSFSTVLALAAILTSVGTLGLPNAVARSLPYETSDDERRGIVRISLWVSVAAAASVAVALFGLSNELAPLLGGPRIALGLQFFSIAIAASIGSTIVASIFQGYSDVTPNALFVQVINPGLFLAFLGVAFVLPQGRLSYVESLAAYAIANAVTLVALLAYAMRRLPRQLGPGPIAPGSGGRLLRFAFPLLVAGAMASLAGFGDTLVLGAYHHLQVATYTASLTLARLLQVGINAAAYIYLPVAARFRRRDNSQAIRLTYTTVTKWMVLLSLPLFLLFVILPQRSLDFVYGPTYAAVLVPLQIAVSGAFLATLFGPGATTQVVYGRVRLLAYNSAAAGIADVGIAFALVPRFGAVGAAIAWGSANVLYAGLCLIEVARHDAVHPFHRHFAAPLFATLVPIGLLLAVFRASIPAWALPPIGLAAAGAFVLAVVVSGSLDDGDRLLLGAVEGLLGRPVPFVRRLARWSQRRRPNP